MTLMHANPSGLLHQCQDVLLRVVEFLGLDTRQALRCAYRNLHLLLLGSLGSPTPLVQRGGIGIDLESDYGGYLLPLDSTYTLCSSQPCL